MKSLKLAALALAVPAFAFAAPWEIDSAHSQAKFTVRHMMVTDVTGTLGKVNGTVDIDEKDLSKSKVDVAIDVAPDTREAKRDEHLSGPDFFDVAKFPKVTFKGKKFEKAGADKIKVTGDLTIKDVTKEVALEVAMSPEFIHPFTKGPVRGATTSTTLNRLDYGLKWQVPMANNSLFVANDVKVDVNVELKKPTPAEAPKAEGKNTAKK